MLARATNVARTMLWRVPASSGEIHSSRKSQEIIDDDDFLVVAHTRRMGAVELKMYARMFERILAENKLDEITRATPAYANGRIYIRTYKNLYCIEEK